MLIIFSLNSKENNQFHNNFINTLQTSSLSTLSLYNQSSQQSSIDSEINLYFMKGNDSRKLSKVQQKQIKSLIDENTQNTSIMIFNPNQVDRKLQNWKNLLPWITPYYAVKSNPTKQILSHLTNLGCGLDCASKSQIETALRLGLSSDKIVYSNSIKDEKDLQWAGNIGIQLTTADSMEELAKIKQYAPEMNVLWRIAIKQQAKDKLSTSFSGKFGDDLQTTDEIHKRMKEIQNIGIKLKGIHFHCGSGKNGSSAFPKALRLARSCIQIGRIYNHEMNLLDIGGGFPAGQIPNQIIEALKTTENDPLGYRVIAEPGRYFASYSFFVAARVIGKRVKQGRQCYHLNESVYHSFNNIIMDNVTFEEQFDQFYSKVGTQITTNLQMKGSTLFGMTCDGLDVIAKNMGVPSDLSIGDWICVGGMGAYTYGCRTNFNGMKSTESIKVMPKSEKYQNLVETQE